MKPIERPSPNFNDRGGAPVDILVLHYTGMRNAEEAIAQLTGANPNVKVSSHYTVDEDGTIYRHVDEAKRAWHAGVSSWSGATDINARSIGIEIVNPGHEFGYRPFTKPQIDAVIELSKGILERWPITPSRVLAHSDVAPGRKIDPGELFPWPVLAHHGVGVWEKVAGVGSALGGDLDEIKEFQSDLARYGYGLEVTGAFDERTQTVTSAFQRHFRPHRFDGVADGETRALIKALLKRLDAIA